MTDPAEPTSMDAIDPEQIAHRTDIIAQPGVTMYNGDKQVPITITSRTTGEVIVFGKRLGERTFEGVHLVLTADDKNGVWWILAIDTTTGSMWQNGYLQENRENALRLLVGGTEADIRSLLMSEPPPSN